MGDVFPELRQHELHTRDTIEDKEASFGKIFLYECASHNAYTQEQALEFLKKKECASHNVYTQEQALEFLEKKNWTIMQSRRYLHIPAQSAVIMHSYSQDVPDCFFREGHYGWLAEIGKFVMDLMNHDNARELLTGFDTYLSHLDFVRWYRTANPWSRKEIYEHVCGKPIFVVENALESMLEHPVLPLTWESPPPGSLKLNFDASYYESGRGGWAGVLRDEKGNIVDIFYGYLDHVDSPYEAEMLALYHSLVKALECGYQDKKLIVEGDCKNLIDAVNGELNCDDDPYVQFYCEINRFKTKFKECQIEFNYREVNSLADFVAGLAAKDIMGDFNQHEIDKIFSIAIDDMRVTRYRFHQAENALEDLWDSLDKAWQEREYEREYEAWQEEQMKEDNFFIWQEQMKEDNLKWLQE